VTDRNTRARLDKEGAFVLESESRKSFLPRLRKIVQGLDQIRWQSLPRPNVSKGTPPTRDLVDWGIQMYSYSLLSHYRELLDTFILLTERGKIPAAFVIGRCLFEMGAHGYYVRKHIVQFLNDKNLNLAWKFLEEINMGNLYMREEFPARDDEDKEQQFPAPREIGKVIRCFNEFSQNTEAVKTYSLLSEYSHPNMGAFSSYYEFHNVGNTITYSFTDPPRNPLVAPLPEVCISLKGIDCVGTLLDLTGEVRVPSQISHILKEYLNPRAPYYNWLSRVTGWLSSRMGKHHG